ncbi:MAG: LuxR C-terminal-related transcriptional regulator [Spirochaetia bacterium]|jgi:DNA-binding CsgD family transcriptional regulator
MSDLSFLKEWIHQRGSSGPDGPGEMVREFDQFFSHIFNNSPDGISILDLDFRILGVNTVMERWYERAAPIVGRRCYEVYHARTSPCENCPTISCIRSGKPQVGVVPFDAPARARGAQELSVLPFFDDAGRLFCLVEYVREITDLNQEQRIVESLKRRIQFQDQTLHEQEVALEVLLRRSGRAARNVEADIASNIQLSIFPVIARLKTRLTAADALADLELLEERLGRITSPLMSRLSLRLAQFTSREREIAGFIMEGKTSKEIAEQLCLTIKAVDFHRMNLRKKLRMGNSNQTLQSRLSGLEAQ